MKRVLLPLLAIFVVAACAPRKNSEDSIIFLKQANKVMCKSLTNTGKPDYGKALPLLAGSVKLDPKNLDAQYLKMNCEFNLGQLDDALRTFNTATANNLKGNKLEPSFYALAAIIEKNKGEHDASLGYSGMLLKFIIRGLKKTAAMSMQLLTKH